MCLYIISMCIWCVTSHIFRNSSQCQQNLCDSLFFLCRGYSSVMLCQCCTIIMEFTRRSIWENTRSQSNHVVWNTYTGYLYNIMLSIVTWYTSFSICNDNSCQQCVDHGNEQDKYCVDKWCIVGIQKQYNTTHKAND